MGMMETCAPYAAMVLVQLAYGVSVVLAKLSFDVGQSQLVFIVYRHVIGMLVLAPLAYVLEKKQRPSLTLRMAAKIFVMASLGTTIHLNVYYVGLEYTSATVASALNNVIPGLTFFLAVLLGKEKVMIRTAKGQAMVMGTITCIGGALLFTFWRGAYLFKNYDPSPLIHVPNSNIHDHQDNWVKGSALLLTSYIAWCAWLFSQAAICEVYPARLSLNTLICFFASLQSSVVALIFDRNPTSWKLGWNVQLITILYSGVISSSLVYFLQTWVISKKGPVFSAMFSPVVVLVVGIFSAIFFAERFHVGSLIGGLLIVIGLYFVLWGRSKQETTTMEEEEEEEKGGKKLTSIPITSTDKTSTNHENQVVLDINTTTTISPNKCKCSHHN